jgi:hypothetical protein
MSRAAVHKRPAGPLPLFGGDMLETGPGVRRRSCRIEIPFGQTVVPSVSVPGQELEGTEPSKSVTFLDVVCLARHSSEVYCKPFACNGHQTCVWFPSFPVLITYRCSFLAVPHAATWLCTPSRQVLH